MCTVSWLRKRDGYVLMCNRDERHTRKPALGPRLNKARGVSLIAPTDGDQGGSWIGVNQFGVTLCLLNRYGDSLDESKVDFISRGLLLLDLLPCGERAEVQQLLGKTRLESFRPFTLAVVGHAEPAMLVHWTGRECIINPDAEADVPLVSSSLQEPQIEILRKQHFRNVKGTLTGHARIARLYEFHRSHFPERGPYSVCMHRDDAATVSLSVVTVTRELIEFAYQGNSPCLEGKVEVARLKG